METHKQTPYLIERLKTAEIDNLKEVADLFPSTFNRVFNELKEKRFYTDITYDSALTMCVYFTFNGKQIDLNEFHKFFKKD